MGFVVTFYSFKGGVGRTMALANIAVLLAERGKRVLAIDWDLEAPGLHRFFRGRLDATANGGLMELLHEAANGTREPSNHDAWRQYVSPVELTGTGRLDVLMAGALDERGRQNPAYIRKLQDFEWDEFFRERDGGAFIEGLRNGWRNEYDLTLIDSRTGFTDAGGVCTIQLPDILVIVFTANHQSVDGVREAVTRAQEGRQKLAYDRMPLLVVPLPSRFDGRAEVEDAKEWLDTFTVEMSEYYDDWLPSGTNYRQVVERMKVPHITKFSFGEKLPVLTESLTDPEGMGYAYDAAARLLADGFKAADEILLGTRVGQTTRKEAGDLNTLMEDLDADMAAWARRVRFISFAPIAVIAGAIGLAILILTGVTDVIPGWFVYFLAGLGGALASLSTATFIDRMNAVREVDLLRRQLRDARVLYAGSRERLIPTYEEVAREFELRKRSLRDRRTRSARQQ